MTDQQQLTAFRAACTGGENSPGLWRLTWLDVLVADAQDGLKAGTFGDTDTPATWECVRECATLARLLRAALEPDRQAAEAQRREEVADAQETDHEIPF